MRLLLDPEDPMLLAPSATTALGQVLDGPQHGLRELPGQPMQTKAEGNSRDPPVPNESPRGSEKPYMLLVQCLWCTRSPMSSESPVGPRQDTCLPKAGLRGHLRTAPNPLALVPAAAGVVHGSVGAGDACGNPGEG